MQNHQADSPLYVQPDVWSADLHLLIKSMVILDTECPFWDQVSLNNANKQTIISVPLFHVCLQIKRSNLSFCMVFATSDQQVNISVHGNTENFQYHRFDIKEPDNMCNNDGRLSTIGMWIWQSFVLWLFSLFFIVVAVFIHFQRTEYSFKRIIYSKS